MKCSRVPVNLLNLAQGALGAYDGAHSAYSARTESEQMPGHSFGNEEVESSILSRSTIYPNDLAQEKEVLRGSCEPRGF